MTVKTPNPPVDAAVLAAAAASLLTDDLIVEILSRLPVRSVHRFKCVSPSWHDLIANPAHLRQAKKTRKKEVTKIATVWCMQDYDSKKWVLKHSVSRDKLPSSTRVDYVVVAIHPDCDTIFLGAFNADTLASYDMQYGKYCHILKLKKRTTGLVLLPYVPLFSDSLAGADGH
ncbi:hypothetical protein ACQ4PT_009850 [Festuca glaucescens]